MAGKKNKKNNKVTVTVNNASPPSTKSQAHRERRARYRKRRRERDRALVAEASASSALLNSAYDYNTVRNSTRKGISPNPADPRTHFQALRNLGSTVNGANWASRVLHPNTENENLGMPKIPDGAYSSSCVLERRGEWKMLYTKASSADTSPWNSAETYSCVLISSPILKHSLAAISYVDSEPSKEDFDEFFSKIQPNVDTEKYQAGTFISADSGKDVFVKIFSCNVWDNDGGIFDGNTDLTDEQVEIFQKYFKTCRRVAHGLTIDFDAPSLSDQGRVIACQVPADITKDVLDFKETITEGDTAKTEVEVVTSSMTVYSCERPPMTVAEITGVDEKGHTGLAKDGVYIPSRYWDVGAKNFKGEDFYKLVLKAGTEFKNVEDVSVKYSNAGRNYMLPGWGYSIAHFTDMSVSASLRIKFREGLEFSPNNDSPYTPFSSPGFTNDYRAMEVVKEFNRISAHAYPADYNDKGGMVSSIISTIGNVLENLNIPVVSNIAGAVGNIGGGLLSSIGL